MVVVWQFLLTVLDRKLDRGMHSESIRETTVSLYNKTSRCTMGLAKRKWTKE
jgi:hypothetical protein